MHTCVYVCADVDMCVFVSVCLLIIVSSNVSYVRVEERPLGVTYVHLKMLFIF